MVDYLATGYDAVARFNGGSNAGHTVVIGDRKHTFHLVPSGALKGKQLLIGAAVALDPVVLAEELALLPEDAKRRTLVDSRCTLVTPVDRELDAKIEEVRGGAALGTTKRGIGPSYALRALRLSPRAGDLLSGFDFRPLASFYRALSLDPVGLAAWAADAGRLLAGLTGDTGAKVAQIAEAGGSVLFEGSQGILLDLLHGTYPYVTSTHATASYIPSAFGIPPGLAGKPLGVMKCYTTRVGSGPFPSEIAGEESERLRTLGNEYGATTGRPRRVGWLDLVSLKYAISLDGVEEVAVTKLDVLSKMDEVKVCTAYSLNGSETSDFQKAMGALDEAKPVLETPFSMRGASFEGGLPPEGRRLIAFIEERLGVRVRVVSHGEERSKTIEL
ncbi:MAG: adenylosuccinate synthetase [Nitrososphaerota archaeon]|nr:adenylosuccinate synthetase [Nitrososphaerota archaeon]